MKKLLLSTALLGASVAAVSAQDMFRAAPDAMEIRASDLMGMRIYASDATVDATEIDGVQDGWNDIGEVGDIILNREGSVDAVLVDVGGFLGIGEREVAVSMDALRFVADSATPDNLSDYFIVVNADRTALEAAPEYVMGDAAAGATVDETTGAVTDPVVTDTAMATDTATETEMAADETAMAADDTAMATDGAMATDDAMATDGAMAADDAAMTADPLATGEPLVDDAGMRTPTAREGFAIAEAGTLTTDRLTGTTVYDANDERIGSVGQLVITADGQVQDVVVDVGGFLGIGQKPVALPMGEIDILQAVDGDELRVYLPQTREQLEAMPSFED